MKINLEWKGGSLFEATDEMGHKIQVEGSPETGGKDLAMRPMETLLASLAGCSSIDVVHILRKGRHEVKDYRVNVTGKRREEVPKYFTEIHLRFEVSGSFSQEVLTRAAALSVDKYCSVVEMLKGTVKITHDAVKTDN